MISTVSIIYIRFASDVLMLKDKDKAIIFKNIVELYKYSVVVYHPGPRGFQENKACTMMNDFNDLYGASKCDNVWEIR